MSAFKFSYTVQPDQVPFSSTKGGTSKRLGKLTEINLISETHIRPLGQAHWVLRNTRTQEIFRARQVLVQSEGGFQFLLQSEMALISGHTYETQEISAQPFLDQHVRNADTSSQNESGTSGIAAGTMIMTARGQIAIEDLVPGDKLITRDNGMQEVLWSGSKTVTQQMVKVNQGTIYNSEDLYICPDYRIVMKGSDAIVLFGKPEVLVPARFLLDDTNIEEVAEQEVTLFHIMLARHELIYAEACAIESFTPSPANLALLDQTQRQQVIEALPELQNNAEAHGPLARAYLDAPKDTPLQVAV